MKVLVFGSINIDLVFAVDHIVLEGETISSMSLTRSAGGKGANQAAALAKAGLETYFAGKIGIDGEFLNALLASYHVNTEHIERYNGATGQAIIQLDKTRQNAIILFAGGNGCIDETHIDRTLACFLAGDILVLQNEIALTGSIIKKAKARGLQIVFNPSPFDDKIEKLPLNKIDIFFVNEVEGARLACLPLDTARPSILNALATRFPNTEIVLTAGKEGVYYGYGSTREKCEIVETSVVDTIGAGDTFLGYFIAARNQGFNIAQTLAAACKASSITISRPGAMEAIPFANEVF